MPLPFNLSLHVPLVCWSEKLNSHVNSFFLSTGFLSYKFDEYFLLSMSTEFTRYFCWTPFGIALSYLSWISLCIALSYLSWTPLCIYCLTCVGHPCVYIVLPVLPVNRILITVTELTHLVRLSGYNKSALERMPGNCCRRGRVCYALSESGAIHYITTPTTYLYIQHRLLESGRLGEACVVYDELHVAFMHLIHVN